MPGWPRRAAQDAVAETGVDMSRFRTGPHLSSWAGRAPQDHQSGKRKGRLIEQPQRCPHQYDRAGYLAERPLDLNPVPVVYRILQDRLRRDGGG